MEAIKTTVTTKIPKFIKTKVDGKECKILHDAGHSMSDIAKMKNVDKSTVCRSIQKYFSIHRDLDEQLEFYQKNKAEVFDAFQLKTLQKITNKLDQPTESIPLKEMSMFLGTIYDKGRLERDQSTENVAGIVSHIDNIANSRLRKQSK